MSTVLVCHDARVTLWTLWLFRIAVTLTALLTFTQAVLAGGFLAGHFGMLAMHRDNSTIAVIAALVMAVAGVLMWRPGRGPWWPALASLGLLVVEVVQTFMGYSRVLSIHIPLGVLTVAAFPLLLVWVWRAPR
jgi:hypothetical protein